MTVTTDLLQTILSNYPVVPSHLIHSAGRKTCLSGAQRLRDLRRDHGIRYSYKGHEYIFETSKADLQAILKGYLSHGRGGVEATLEQVGTTNGPSEIESLPSRPAPTPMRLF